MGFQSSFNQALGIVSGVALGAKHLKGQKESLAEQKMQGKFNLESEIDREQEQQEQQEVAEYNKQHGTDYIDKNEMMADRAGQALASETTSKGYTYRATIPEINKEWVKKYMEWYGVDRRKAEVEFKKQHMVVQRIPKEEGGNK